MRSINAVAVVGSLVSNGLSLAACAWLLRRVGCLDGRAGRLLFARQLRQLALADSLVALASLLYSPLMWSGILMEVSEPAALAICKVDILGILGGAFVSILVEAYIAVGLASAYWRWLRLATFLAWSLPLLWPMGLIVALLHALLLVVYEPETGSCVLEQATWVHLGAWLFLSCVLVPIVCYATTIGHAWRHPEGTRGLVWRVAWLYPANFLCTYGLLLSYFVVWPAFRASLALFAVALILEGANGLMNTMAYACSSRYLHRRRASDAAAASASGRSAVPLSVGGHVAGATLAFDGVPPLQCRSLLGEAEEHSDLVDFISFHVGFRSTFASEVLVPDIHEEAARRSEFETIQLQRERERRVAGGAGSEDATSSGNSSSVASYVWEVPPSPRGYRAAS